MTISKGAWNIMRRKKEWLKHFFPRIIYDQSSSSSSSTDKASVDEKKEDTHITIEPLPKAIEDKEGIGVVIDDFLGYLRNTSIDVWEGKNDGQLHIATCEKYMKKVFTPLLVCLVNCPSVHTYVVCLDPYGKRRKEKAATTNKRKRQSRDGAPDTLAIPFGQTRYFEHDKIMPGPIDIIFATPEAKVDFYRYITEYLLSSTFRSEIPEGKFVILSGGLGHANEEPIAPVRIQRSKFEVMGPEYFFPTLSEGDLDAWRWVHVFKDENIHVVSYDGDVFLIGLLQMRYITDHAKNTSKNVWFVTRRSVDSQEQTPSSTQKKKELTEKRESIYDEVLLHTSSIDQAFHASGGVVGKFRRLTTDSSSSSSSSSSSIVSVPTTSSSSSSSSFSSTSRAPRKKINWLTTYVNVTGIYLEILKEAQEIVKSVNKANTGNKEKFKLHNPVETFVAVLCLSSDSHDYINTKAISNYVDSTIVWSSFLENLVFVGDIVRVYSQSVSSKNSHSSSPNSIESSEESSEESSSSSSNSTFQGHIYGVDVSSLRRLIECVYREKARRSISPSKINNTAEKLAAARERSYQGLCQKYAPSENTVQIVAAQIAWLLQYWGNGVHSNYKVIDGLTTKPDTTDPTKQISVYGYAPDGWADSVAHSKFKLAPIPDH